MSSENDMKTKEEYLAIVERTLDETLPKETERPAVLSEAMRYAVGTGGKRIRPLICLAAAEAVGGSAVDAAYPAAAIEMLHNYTLVHDDLPAMDNDTLRRGKPTVWTKYGHANAILVGDALQALAFRTAARAPRNVAAIVGILGEKGVGVVQGQVEDLLLHEPSDPPTRQPSASELVDFVYEHKTADLFIAAATMGGYAGGGSPDSINALRRFALNLGLAFQYEDDLLDGDSPYPKEETERLVAETTAAAVAALAELPGDTAFLSALARKLVGRTV